MRRHIVNPQNIVGYFNKIVQTPLGEGMAFGLFQLRTEKQEGISHQIVVRLPVNEATRPHLRDDNCLTPYANKSAIFTFDHEQVLI